MSDLIRREDALAVLCFSQETGQMVCGDLRKLLEEIKAIPSAEPEFKDTYEWCTECKEYDHDKHCCPRWNKVIRKTIEEMQLSGKIAKVIDRRYDHNLRRYGRCENCHSEVVERYTYCPNCGARLEWE